MKTTRHFLRELSAVTGIDERTLRHRWNAGDRDERLTRPVDPEKNPMKGRADSQQSNTDLVEIACHKLTRSEEKAQAAARAEAAIQSRRLNAARLRTQLLEAIRQPLIDGGLLSEQEREAIRARVVGHQRWRAMGGELR